MIQVRIFGFWFFVCEWNYYFELYRKRFDSVEDIVKHLMPKKRPVAIKEFII